MFQRGRIRALLGEDNFEQTGSTRGAIVNRLVDRKTRAAVLLETRQLS
jgi:hypothetical protein